ncbi:hypothetical protein [Mucilaginibacter aquatilis]|uniref:Uncharacterized protein n=1 Tax=Mucilaginibacter aquatilis TaxID=1517760 RepID=A0A6I4I971_9SPHI|nr:hypothetical protein [Mucilaginibacter aquatilis]MVN91497.1 hypothetical protein [Mucilaginibacter aquatilis]
MKYIALQVLGMIMMAVGAAIFIKSMFSPTDPNFLVYVTGNFWTRQVICACLAVIGVLVTRWAAKKREADQ